MSDFDAPLARVRAATDGIAPTERQLARWQAAAALALTERPRPRRSRPWMAFAASAAGICVLAGVGALKIATRVERVDATVGPVLTEAARFHFAQELLQNDHWLEARYELRKMSPGYPGVAGYLARAEREVPNELALDAANAALERGDLAAVSEALDRVSADSSLYAQARQLRHALDVRIVEIMALAQQARAEGDQERVKQLTDSILAVRRSDVAERALDGASGKVIEERSFRKVAAASRPDEAGVLRFLEGDLTGAIALEDDCAAKGVVKCKATANGMRKFAEMYKKLEDLDAHGLKKLLALDREITDGRRSKLAKAAGIKLGTELCKGATAAKAAGLYARAGELASQASQADPENNCASAILNDLKIRAHDLFMLAYSLKDQDPNQAVEKFKQVIQMTAADSEDSLKAAKWIRELQ
jgi:hypothetical protein